MKRQACRIWYRQRGMVVTEYLLGTLLIGIVLFAPLPGMGESVFVFLLDSLRGFQSNTTYIMSMP